MNISSVGKFTMALVYTLVITSCNSFELFDRTLQSSITFCDVKPPHVFIADDPTQPKRHGNVIHRLGKSIRKRIKRLKRWMRDTQ